MKTFLTYIDENSFGPALDKMYPMGEMLNKSLQQN